MHQFKQINKHCRSNVHLKSWWDVQILKVNLSFLVLSGSWRIQPVHEYPDKRVWSLFWHWSSCLHPWKPHPRPQPTQHKGLINWQASVDKQFLMLIFSSAFCWPLHNWKPYGYWQVKIGRFKYNIDPLAAPCSWWVPWNSSRICLPRPGWENLLISFSSEACRLQASQV